MDRQGRAYIGNLGFGHTADYPCFAPAEIVLVTPDGRARVVADNPAFPNRTVITPNGGTLIVAESWGGRLTVFDIQPDGSLTRPRVWAQLDRILLSDGSLTVGRYWAELQRNSVHSGRSPDGICLSRRRDRS